MEDPTIGSRRDETDTPSEDAFDALRTERWIAVIRLLVVAVIGLIYLGSVFTTETSNLGAASLLLFAVIYATWSLTAFSGPTEPSTRARLLSTCVDVALVTVWIQATGGAKSEYWALYLIVIISVAMRFDLLRALLASVTIALLYLGVVAVDGGLRTPYLLHRTSLMVIIGFAVGILAEQQLLHRRRGQQLGELADERSQELTHERAEIDRLQRVDSAKSEFVAVAAHEFRTPLAAVIGVLSTLREHWGVITPEERLELIDGAASQAARLARLVDDLLTVSRIEDGALRLAFESVEPRDLLAEAAQTSGMTGRLVIQIGRLDRIRCDPDAVIRVLTNLLDNARKYSPSDSKVHIKVAAESDLVRFFIRDEGPGIPEEERAQVFERFRRLDGGKGKAGAGLGLYICRGLVEAHGGTIRADQPAQGGAEFSFTLPTAAKADEEAQPSVGNTSEPLYPGSPDDPVPLDVEIEVPVAPSAAVS